jgi:hypothetical protein
MREILLTGLAALTFLSSGTLGKRVDAMPLAMPSAIRAATAADAARVQQVVAVCGNNGCVQVQVSGPKKPRTHP